jgi:predicted GTPase
VLDALRPGHELTYHPGEANFRMADVLVVAKAGSAPPANVEAVLANARAIRPEPRVVDHGTGPPRRQDLDPAGRGCRCGE